MFNDLFSNIRTIYHKVKLPESPLNRMASNSPQVSGYLPPAVYNVPPDVYDQLMAFKAKRGLQSVEMAVTVILSEYFGLSQTSAVSATETTVSRLETLEAKCTTLNQTVAELRAAIATLQPSSSPPVGESEPTTSQPEPIPILDAQAATDSASTPEVDQSVEPLHVDQSIETLHATSLPTSMTQVALAKRLGVNTSTISRMQSKPNFSEWSQQKDPEGIAWVRSPDTKLFYPQQE